MRIAINVRFLIKDKLEGIGWFTYESIKRICLSHPEHEFYLLFDRPYDNDFIFASNVKPLIITPPARHPVLWKIWFHYRLPRVLKKHNIEFFISTDGYMPLSLTIPSVNVIHDINFEHRPKDLKPSVAGYYKKYFPRYAETATRLATVSEFSKSDIIKTYGTAESKIDVVYNGANIDYTPVDEVKKEEIKKKYTLGEDYFIFIGSLHPRKNVARLIRAFDTFRATNISKMKLLIVGEAMFMTDDIKEAYEMTTFKEDIIFTGRVSTEDLHLLLGSAYAMVFVPFFEGFGIPILEAMYCDVPVICSNVTSMPEVGGDAVLYADPYLRAEIVEAMNTIVENPDLREDLINKGRIQRQKFSWDKTAELLWKSVLKAMEEKPRAI